MFASNQVERAFHFQSLPPAVGYLIGLWGCGLATISWGYFIAAANPLRHRVWIQAGIGRGVLECALGAVYLARGTVTFQQAGFGIIVAALISVAYIVLYPRKPRLVASGTNPIQPPAPAI